MVDKKGQSEDVSMIDVRQVFSDRDFVHLACSKMCQFVSVLQVPHAFLILCELSANVSVYGRNGCEFDISRLGYLSLLFYIAKLLKREICIICRQLAKTMRIFVFEILRLR